MDVTMIGLQNAGKSSLLRVLAGGEFTVEYVCLRLQSSDLTIVPVVPFQRSVSIPNESKRVMSL